MIQFPTVFILGAGASAPYGFPCGRHLIDTICDDLDNLHSKFKLNLQKCEFDEQQIIDFRRALHLSMLPSIDIFLERRPEFNTVGKAAIAQAIIPFEKPNSLYRNASEENWYEYLFAQLDTSVENFHDNKLSIVTFNYDRSLEFFLFTALKNSFNLENEQAAIVLSKSIEIIHLHGQLGSFPFLDHTNERHYTPEIKPHLVNMAASCIKLPNEEIEEARQFTRAHELIAKAKIVCFLGFGFHPINTKRLISKVQETLQNNWNFRTFHGTGFGIMEGERQPIKTMFGGRIKIGDHDEGILSYLRSNPIFLKK